MTDYRLIEGEYGKSDLYELLGETIVSAVPEIIIQWDDLVGRLPHDY
ncbi:MAG: hypothetical protein ACXWTL_00435 [Methylobacter sp.]